MLAFAFPDGAPRVSGTIYAVFTDRVPVGGEEVLVNEMLTDISPGGDISRLEALKSLAASPFFVPGRAQFAGIFTVEKVEKAKENGAVLAAIREGFAEVFAVIPGSGSGFTAWGDPAGREQLKAMFADLKGAKRV